ncbi:hypothetical protein [Pantoea ananatis]|uniref:hypothetical protein n=1 Tax=Pantoea ananas TaxID=553 RepID=UPI0004961A0E|nr:hypothetical protein [Pantoea ananatis]
MTTIFNEQPVQLYNITNDDTRITDESGNQVVSMGFNIEKMVEQLMAEGYDAEEAGAAVLRYIDKQKTEQHNANASAMKLRTDKERAEYMRQLRSQVSPNVWIPPQLQEEYASEQRVAEAQEQFKQNMKARASRGGMMRSTQAAIEFFRNKP